ncbi:MYOME protein, partial [Baryphthengus martii]|nr:MYOME protein [Baryphthengus martii]
SSPWAPKESGGTERTPMGSTAAAVPERELRAEEELRELKAQLEEAGFSSVSHIRQELWDAGASGWQRLAGLPGVPAAVSPSAAPCTPRKAMLSLCLENAELKERMGEATLLLESGEQEEAGLSSLLDPETHRLRRKSRSSLGDQPAGSSGGGQGGPVERGTVPTKRPALEARPQDDMPKRLCPSTPGRGDGSHGQSTIPDRSWPGLDAELRSQVTQGQRQCRELQDKLAASEATMRAQAEQLQKYHVLLREPHAQQLSKQVQVDFQDLGYETCGRSETEADREETTSPGKESQGSGDPYALPARHGEVIPCSVPSAECEEPDVFSEPSLGEEPGSSCRPEMPRVGKATWKAMAPTDVGALHQHIQDLKVQLLNANKVIQSLQHRARSISVTSGYASGAERPPPGPTALASSARSLTDEDEGWQSDGHGTLCPPVLRAHHDLQLLVHRVTLLEAQLTAAKPAGVLPKELQSATWPGKYDSLIQAQARELSHLRQMLREGRGMSRTLAQQLRDALCSFEDLLHGTDIDYYLGQGFREQLVQGRQLAERLGDKLGTKDQQGGDDKTSHELLALRLSQELQEKEKVIESLEAKLQERCESPGSSCPPSETSCSATSSSFVSEGLEPCSDGEVGSMCSQCHKEPAQLTGLHFDSLSKPVSAALPVLAPGLLPFLPAGPPAPAAPPLLGCCGTPVCSLAEAQQELQVLQRQLGESVTLPVTPAKPTGPLGPCRQGGKGPASLCQHGALQSLAKVPRANETPALWDVPPPGPPLYGALPLEFPCSQKLTGADLLEEHLVEIRSLRQRLEESICTNDRLREQLECRLTSAGKATGLPSDVYAQMPEPGLQLSRENQVLRDDNRTLRLQHEHLSQELARVQEMLLATCSRAWEAEAELGQRRGEQQRLAEELAKSRESVQQLRDERRALQEDNNRLQHTVTLLQQQSEEHRALLQTLRAEPRVYETLTGPSAETHASCFPSPPVRDVGTSSAAPLFSPLPSDTAVSRRMDEPRGADPLAKKSEGPTGAHVVGRLDTYRTLEQHILEGKALARELMYLMCPALGLSNCPLLGKEAVGWRSAGHLWGSASTLHRVLEECASLLTAFWSTVLPASPAQHQSKDPLGLLGPKGTSLARGELVNRVTPSHPRSRSCRVRSRCCAPSSPRGRTLCRARPSGCAAQPSSRTAWSASSSAS